MTLTTEQGIADAFSGITLPIYKAAVGLGNTPYFASYWGVGNAPAAGATPTAAAQCVRSTTGALAGWSDPAGGAKTHIAYLSLAQEVTNYSYSVYDRLIHSGGLVGNVITAQTTNLGSFPAIPRGDTTGEGVELWLEFYATIGSTTSTATISYTNQDGTAGRTATLAFSTGSSYGAGQMVPVPLQAGDSGVRSVQSVTLAPSTGTAGNFGITLLRRLTHHGVPQANVATEYDWLLEGLPTVEDGACLAFMGFNSGNTGAAPRLMGEIKLIQG